jgi:hypothetical protein
MSNPYNPYEAPSGGYGMGSSEMPPMGMGGGNMITPLMLEHLRGTKGWVRLFSILSFIGAGLMLLGAFSVMVAFSALPGIPGSSKIPGFIVGLVYLPFAGFYLLPAVLLHRLANAMDNASMIPSSSTMEDALDKNRVFWKVMGIAALVLIGMSVLLTMGAFFLGIMAAALKP